MSNYVCRYPDGIAGVALLLIRVGYALAAFGVAAALPGGARAGTALYVATALVALCLLLGFATRGAALVLGVAVVVVALVSASPMQQLILAGHVGGCLLIVLIGAGAFSIDARRHGRRVIHLQTKTPDRGAGD
jgi:uncharacterized membrane protein YphA (DoxX/SURF4 family)